MPIGRGRSRPNVTETRPPGSDSSPRPPVTSATFEVAPVTQVTKEQKTEDDKSLYEEVFQDVRSESWINEWAGKCMAHSYGRRERCKELVKVLTNLDASNVQHKMVNNRVKW